MAFLDGRVPAMTIVVPLDDQWLSEFCRSLVRWPGAAAEPFTGKMQGPYCVSKERRRCEYGTAPDGHQGVEGGAVIAVAGETV
ncbi:hypothetical protein [Micromonospora aurantiaca (nom. illeg.)]|uniref:hypothetical protein n=1 Tax=Micromonospora aurantiaca (nom. illeg.) TaxID=47850 RepID=UPI0035B3DFB4